MPNLNYKRSRARETKTVNLFKKDGDFATRTPGSKSPIDVIAFRPPTCGHCDCPDVFQHTHVQIKVSEHIKKGSIIQTEIEHPFPMPLEIWKFPVKVKKKKA